MPRADNLILDEAHIGRNIFRLALPAVGEMILHTLVGVVDTIMIGQALGTQGVAAVGLGGGVIFPLLFLVSSIGVGATAVVARLWGAKDYIEARKVGGQSLLISLGLGAFVLLVGRFLMPGLAGSFTDEAFLAESARGYVEIISLGGLPWVAMMVGTSVMRGVGDNVRPLIITAIANVLNVILNYLLIYGIGPFPEMGINGAALASAISITIAFIATLIILYGGFSKTRLRIAETLRPCWKTIKRIFHIGTPAIIEQGFFRIGHIVTVWIISSMGTLAMAVHQVGMQVESLSFMPGWGMAIASTTLVGQYLGAGKPELAEKVGYRSAFYAVIFMGAMGVVFALFSEELVGVFIKEGSTGLKLIGSSGLSSEGNWLVRVGKLFPPINGASVLRTGSLLIVIAAMEQPALALMMTLTGSLRGAGDTRFTMFLSLIGFWGMRLPFALLAVFVLDWGIIGFWALATLAFYIRAVLVLGRFRHGKWKKLKV